MPVKNIVFANKFFWLVFIYLLNYLQMLALYYFETNLGSLPIRNKGLE